MKRLLIFFITLFAIPIAKAQNFDFYALAGPVVSQIDGDRVGGYNKMGGVFGVGVSRAFDDKWCAQMELGYIQKGKGTYNESDGSSYKIRLNYIELPIVAGYKVAENIQIETGVSFGFLMSYQFLEDGEPNNDHRTYTPYFYDIDWLLSATYSITEEWKINMRFAYSIIPMGDTIEEDVYRPNFWQNPGGQYNRTLSLMLQYWF